MIQHCSGRLVDSGIAVAPEIPERISGLGYGAYGVVAARNASGNNTPCPAAERKHFVVQGGKVGRYAVGELPYAILPSEPELQPGVEHLAGLVGADLPVPVHCNREPGVEKASVEPEVELRRGRSRQSLERSGGQRFRSQDIVEIDIGNASP